MTDQLQMIHELLQEQRVGLHKATSLLGDLRVEVAAMQRAQESQAASLAEIRGDLRQIYDRLREAELQMQRIPALESEVARQGERLAGYDRANQRRTEELEKRLRALEGDGREHKVISGAIAGGARGVWNHLAGALVAALIAAVVVTARAETSPARSRQAQQAIGEPAGR